MARSFDYRTTTTYPADAVYAAMIDPEHLRARLKELGGPGAELLEHEAGPDGARYRLRQGVAAEELPGIVTKIMPNGLVIERTETITKDGPGRYRGDVEVDVPGAPVVAGGRMQLADAGGGSEFGVDADVDVKVPLIGGRIEGIVADQVRNLLSAEMEFTKRWLAQH